MTKRSKCLGDQLRTAIDASDKTRYRLALECDIDESQLAKFYNGRSGFSLAAMERLANALGYEIILQKKQQKAVLKKGN